jgi:predicted NAD/FAD-binding protein
MKIAVVGAGIAGLGAAWVLSKQHEVVIYEQSSQLGGHALTVDYTSPQGKTVPVDVGFLVFHPWMYPNLSALFEKLGVDTISCPHQSGVCAEFGNDIWRQGDSTPFWERVRPEAQRFERSAQDIVANPQGYLNVSTEAYLDGQGYSEDFKYKCVLPLITTLNLTRQNLLQLSILNLASLFGPIPLYSFSQISPWYTVTGGSREYVNRLAAETNARFVLNASVKSITRSPQQVHIEWGDGNKDSFDQVVIATHADTALKLLQDASMEETSLLGSMTYEASPGVVHTDSNAMPRDRDLWAKFNYIAKSNQAPFDKAFYTLYIPYFQPWIESDIFVSVHAPKSLIEPDKVLQRIQWKHLVINTEQALASAELYRIQGKKRTWFCGEYASVMAGHDLSFITGLSVGKALGADYPFENQDAARAMFYNHAVYHMKLLPESASNQHHSYSFPTQIAQQTHYLLQSVAEDTISHRLNQFVPKPWQSTTHPLVKLTAHKIASQISLYQAYKHQND